MEKTTNDESSMRIEILNYILSKKWYLIANNLKNINNKNLKKFNIINQLLTYQNDLDRFYCINLIQKRKTKVFKKKK